MDKKLEELLVKRYPIIFQNYGGDPAQTCMAWGMSCGNGWYGLINKTCFDIEKICNEHKLSFTAEQVKEKFGGLRFYYSLCGEKQNLLKTLERFLFKQLIKVRLGRVYWKIVDCRKSIYTTPAEKISTIISIAEEISYSVCQTCGAIKKVKGKCTSPNCSLNKRK